MTDTHVAGDSETGAPQGRRVDLRAHPALQQRRPGETKEAPPSGVHEAADDSAETAADPGPETVRSPEPAPAPRPRWWLGILAVIVVGQAALIVAATAKLDYPLAIWFGCAAGLCSLVWAWMFCDRHFYARLPGVAAGLLALLLGQLTIALPGLAILQLAAGHHLGM
ncbi:MAG: hypothetical protein ACRDP1_07820 [Nocardioidaceae bacterium]